MVAGGISSVVPRLKREECKRTKHDSNFSDWKILIGPTDWDDYSRGKEGSARYRIHNLPEKSSPGVYELGVAVSPVGLGRKIDKLDPDRIVVVYLGKADNLRTRLQQWGRTGAHLSNSCLTSDPNDANRPCTHEGKGFFEDIFSQGYPIIYRWAPMQIKEDAVKTESQLLKVFDYAWNTSNNVTRRPDDIIQKIKTVALSHTTFLNMAKLLQPFTQKRVGLRIKSSSMPSPDGKLQEIDRGGYNLLSPSQVFKFGRSNPRLVQDVPRVTTIICGAVLDDGSVCTRPPAERRMRCVEHKGMKINGSTSKRGIKSGNNQDIELIVPYHLKSEGHGKEPVSQGLKIPLHTAVENPLDGGIANICGIILSNGTPCRRPPVEGRKRCHQHKGERINQDRELIVPYHLKSEGYGGEHVSQYFKGPSHNAVQSPLDGRTANTCGIILSNGTPCRRPPVEGRKRCHQHKGERINQDRELIVPYHLKSEGYGGEHVSQYFKGPSHNAVRSPLDGRIANTCGIILSNGTPCRRPPVEGRKRCHQHKGERINQDRELIVPYHLKSEGYGEEHVSQYFKGPSHNEVRSPLDGRTANTCGIILSNGTPCRRPPVEGRKRCHQHKGERINQDRELILPYHLKSEGYGGEHVSQYFKGPSHNAVRSPLDGRTANTCGIILSNGTPCRRPPVQGRKRCHQHKGKRI